MSNVVEIQTETSVDEGSSNHLSEKEEGEDENTYRKWVVTEFDKVLAMARDRALFDVFLMKLTPILGLSSVTWATIVLLGGFAGSLSFPDFLTITFLVLMIGVRSAFAFLFSNVTGKSRQRIVNRDPKDADLRADKLEGDNSFPFMSLFNYIRAGYISVHLLALAMIGEGIFVLSAAGLSVWRLISIHNEAESPLNMKISLYIYFTLVLLNAPFPVFYLILARFQLRCDKNWSVAVNSYFDGIWSRALNGSISHAVNFNIFDFFFDLQARNYAHNKEPEKIQEYYRPFFNYLFAHPDGFLLLQKCLDSEDVFKQRAAVKAVSIWSDSTVTDRRLQRILPKVSNRFIEKLIAKTMDSGSQLGYDAADALYSLLKCLQGMGSALALSRICKNGNGLDGIVEFLGCHMDESNAYLCLLVAILQCCYSELGVAPVESPKTAAKMRVYARDTLCEAGLSHVLPS